MCVLIRQVSVPVEMEGVYIVINLQPCVYLMSIGMINIAVWEVQLPARILCVVLLVQPQAMTKALVGRSWGKVPFPHQMWAQPVYYTCWPPTSLRYCHVYMDVCIASPGPSLGGLLRGRGVLAEARFFTLTRYFVTPNHFPSLLLFPALWVHKMAGAFFGSGFLGMRQFPSPGEMWDKIEGRLMIHSCGTVAERPCLFFRLGNSEAMNIVFSGHWVKGYVYSCGGLNPIFGYQVWRFFFYRYKSSNSLINCPSFWFFRILINQLPLKIRAGQIFSSLPHACCLLRHTPLSSEDLSAKRHSSELPSAPRDTSALFLPVPVSFPWWR